MKSILHEVKMSPERLQRSASQANAKTGFEVEITFPWDSAKIDISKPPKFTSVDQISKYFSEFNSPGVIEDLVYDLQSVVDRAARMYPQFDSDEAERRIIAKRWPDPESVVGEFDYVQWIQYQAYNGLKTQLAKLLDTEVIVSSERHDVDKSDYNAYFLEPDPTITAEEGYFSVEIVSPPQTLEKTVADLEKLASWCKSIGGRTNDSTGLHISVSVPNMDQLDYVKLITFVGDRYVLDQFGRLGNEFANLSTERLQDSVHAVDIDNIFKQLSRSLDTNAQKLITNFSKMDRLSVKFRGSYVEFRSPGGDWLSGSFTKIINTINRFVFAMQIATDPSMYQREYAIKLYNLLSTSSENRSPIKLFAQVKAGTVSKANYHRYKQLINLPIIVVNNGDVPKLITIDGKVVYGAFLPRPLSKDPEQLKQVLGIEPERSIEFKVFNIDDQKYISPSNVKRINYDINS